MPEKWSLSDMAADCILATLQIAEIHQRLLASGPAKDASAPCSVMSCHSHQDQPTFHAVPSLLYPLHSGSRTRSNNLYKGQQALDRSD